MAGQARQPHARRRVPLLRRGLSIPKSPHAQAAHARPCCRRRAGDGRMTARCAGSRTVRLSRMRRSLIVLGAGTALMVFSGGVARTAAAAVGSGLPAPGTGVLAKPVTGTPHFSVTDSNHIEQVRQLVQCGGTMYAVGSFSQILHGSAVRRRKNVFSFGAT